MGIRRQGPEGARKSGAEGETDVEGHAPRRDRAGATHPIDEPGAGPEHARRAGAESEDDVEGHNFGHNAMLSRSAAQNREREIQRDLKQHSLKSEARRPFIKGR